MNQYMYLSVLFAFLNYCLCATFYDLSAYNRDHPDKCYDQKTNHLFSPGESYKPIGRCIVLQCIRPGEVQGYSCGKVIMPDDCKELDQDLTKPHPYCCERFLCPDQVIYNPSIPSYDVEKPNKVLHERSDNYL